MYGTESRIDGATMQDAPTSDFTEEKLRHQLVREGARRMLLAALEVEVEEYLSQSRGKRDREGRAMVVRNGRARERSLTTGAGALAVLYLRGLSTGEVEPAREALLVLPVGP